MEIAQKNPSQFLERIIQKRKDTESTTEGESDESKNTCSSSTSDDQQVSAQKRRKISSNAMRKSWSKKKSTK